MDDASAAAEARALLEEFAQRTGLTRGSGAPRRYLWTDAFAVSTLLELARAEGDAGARELALALVDQVHEVLGRHRPDDPRSGWISGLDEPSGRAHPTRGGLRIGKPRAERRPSEPFDERGEWDRDGQYFHYLTRWMQALARCAEATGEGRYLAWAIELGVVAHGAFTYSPSSGGPRRMVWKLSVDLSRPQVASMGQHDPLDGLLTLRALQRRARRAGLDEEAEALAAPIADLRAMTRDLALATSDPLGLGGLLGDALRLTELVDGRADDPDLPLLPALLEATDRGLAALRRSGSLDAPPEWRLPFRELGLAIGLRGLPRLVRRLRSDAARLPAAAAVAGAAEGLLARAPLAEAVVRTWLPLERRALATWRDHEDINAVMLAACLVPGGVLGA